MEKRRKAEVKVNECHLIPFLCNRRIDLEIFTSGALGSLTQSRPFGIQIGLFCSFELFANIHGQFLTLKKSSCYWHACVEVRDTGNHPRLYRIATCIQSMIHLVGGHHTL